MNLLFVCSENKLRSATAEAVFSAYDGFSAVGCGTGANAVRRVSKGLVSQADIIFVMEQHHRDKIRKKYKGMISDRMVICLGIPDEYNFMQSELVHLLEATVAHFLMSSSVLTEVSLTN